MAARTGFFAFPGNPQNLSSPINTACEISNRSATAPKILPWPQMEVFGKAIADEIRSNIEKSDVIVADVTIPNFNVYYEIGFAIGRGKSIAPVVNVSFADAIKNLTQDGFFDTIGYATYENSVQLVEILRNPPTSRLVDLYSKPLNTSQPLYILDTVRKTDFRNAMVSSVKDAKVFYRSFDPVETPRFSTVHAIGEVTSSAGVVVPLLGADIDDASRHNLRAAFLAGISHGVGRRTLMLRSGSPSEAVPLDYRDIVDVYASEPAVEEGVKAFSLAALVATQDPQLRRTKAKSKLQSLSLGASKAEDEFRTLDGYFVETAEFVRTLRGEATIVSGRKGSGKTAIFYMVRDAIRERKNSLVTDLKPESHQLSLFRQELLKLVDLGVFDHTLAAFWYFVFLTELVFTIRREYNHRSKFNLDSLGAINEIDIALSNYGVSESGDFTSRINKLSRFVLDEIKSARASGATLSPERLTNIVFKGGIHTLKQLIVKYSDSKTQIVLLFDNIDKGWPTNGVAEFDIRLIRLMIEALDKLRRDLDALHREFWSTVFLRNDIYELLVEQTPDRGKAGQIRIDWNDRAKLRMVMYRRLQSSSGKSGSFSDLWLDVFVADVDGRDSFEYCVDHCLMRPRFLITIVENAIANAINRVNAKVSVDDLRDAVRQHSNYLISEFGFEIRDASGLTADILFALVGAGKRLEKAEIIRRFRELELDEPAAEEAFRLMLWYGAIGVMKGSSERYIYDYDYSLKRLQAEARQESTPLYVVNAALHVALV